MPFAEADETAVIVDDRCPAGGINGRHLADVARENRSNPARCSSPPLPRMLLNYGQFEPDISSPVAVESLAARIRHWPSKGSRLKWNTTIDIRIPTRIFEDRKSVV